MCETNVDDELFISREKMEACRDETKYGLAAAVQIVWSRFPSRVWEDRWIEPVRFLEYAPSCPRLCWGSRASLFFAGKWRSRRWPAMPIACRERHLTVSALARFSHRSSCGGAIEHKSKTFVAAIDHLRKKKTRPPVCCEQVGDSTEDQWMVEAE
jgi:hypothetical protein